MFLPDQVTSKNKQEEERKKAYQQIESWSMTLIPTEIRKDALVSVQEVQCGDPSCSPIDTAVTVQFSSGQQGIFGLPMEAKEVTMEELRPVFPSEDVLQKWHKGEDAEWPPEPELPQLRFDVGERVECRLGANQWSPGTVSMLWYREANWPPGAYAPYQITLDDGRKIFAPGDVDQVIRRAAAAAAATQSA